MECVLVIPDAPSCGLDFGIDCMNYETGHLFKGVSMIPTGIHLVYFSTGMGCREGFFIWAKQDEIVVRPWDVVNEEISPFNSLSESSNLALRMALQQGELNSVLGPYPLDQLSMWKNLSCFINERILMRANCSCTLGALIHPGEAFDLMHARGQFLHDIQSLGTNRVIASYSNIENCIAMLLSKHQSDPAMSQAGRADAVTRLHLDKSPVLEALVSTFFESRWEDLLGELQLSFVLFVFLFSYSALEHWKQLISVICSSESVLLAQSTFTCHFLRLFYEQLSFAPADFFESELSSDNFLRPSMTSLFSSLGLGETAALHPTVAECSRRLLLYVKKRFGLFEVPVSSADSSVDGGSSARHKKCKHYSTEQVQVEGEEMNLMDEDMPVVLDVDKLLTSNLSHDDDDDCNDNMTNNSDEILTCEHITNIKEQLSLMTMTEHDLLNAKFSWRYPELFTAMTTANATPAAAQFDLVMFAAKILDEQSPSTDAPGSILYKEACMFVENEVSKM